MRNMETSEDQLASSDSPVTAKSRSSTSSNNWRRHLIRWAPRTFGLLILLLLAFLGVDLVAGFKSLGQARIGLLIPALGLFMLSVSGRMATWVLIAFSLKVGYRRALSYIRLYLVGLFAAIGIPQGAASLTRLAVIAADGRSVGRGMAAMAVERVVQAAVVLILLMVSSLSLSALPPDVTKWLLISVAVVFVGLALVVLAIRLRAFASLTSRLPAHRYIRTFAEDFKAAIHELMRLPARWLIAIFAVAFAAALVTVASLFLAALSLDIYIRFDILLAAWAVIGLTGFLPISINGLGPREGILTAAVAGIGLNSEGGVALGLLWFLMQMLTRLIAGLAYFTVLHSNREGPPLPESSEVA